MATFLMQHYNFTDARGGYFFIQVMQQYFIKTFALVAHFWHLKLLYILIGNAITRTLATRIIIAPQHGNTRMVDNI